MLRDLNELLLESTELVQKEISYVSEYKFSETFKTSYKELVNNRAIFQNSTVLIPTSTKTVAAPSIWFWVACHLTDLLDELEKYKSRVEEILTATNIINLDTEYSTWADEIRKGNKTPEAEFVEYSKSHFGEDETDKILKFITDYSYWGGGKSIGRSQNDFAHSVLLKASGLLNESSGYLSSIVYQLKTHPSLKEELLKSVVKLNSIIEQEPFNLTAYSVSLKDSGLLFSETILTRFVASLLTKPFVLLSGLSGSGKTKLAQSFVQWICQDESQYKIVPVGADWTNREPLLGYPNGLNSEEYIKPDNGVLDLILSAITNKQLPHFLILDEMNLSHVERYFADFLSVMESNDTIKLHSGEEEKSDVPSSITLPSNLFIIGTVNIDETTYMFSPKVLDRANAVEFRITTDEMNQYFTESPQLDLDQLRGKGALMAVDFLEKAHTKIVENKDAEAVKETLVKFFAELQKTGAEFGYRSASEIIRLINQLKVIDAELALDTCLDIAIMQKLLPKLHGSRRKLLPVLEQLAGFCIKEGYKGNIEKDILLNKEFDHKSEFVQFPISLEKITRMYHGAIDNGFASYAEA